MKRSFNEYYDRAKKINPDFERINGVMFTDVKEKTEPKLFTLKELKIAGCVAAAVTLWSVFPKIHDYADYFIHVRHYIAAIEDAADDVQDVIDDNKDALSAASSVESDSDFAMQHKSLISTSSKYLTHSEVNKLRLTDISKNCTSIIKMKQGDASSVSSSCVSEINNLKQQITQELIGLKDYKEKQYRSLLAKTEVSEIYNDMLAKINDSASSNKLTYVKMYGKDGYTRKGVIQDIDRLVNSSLQINEFNKRITDLIAGEKGNATKILAEENLIAKPTQSEPVGHSESPLQQEQVKQVVQPAQQNPIIQPEQQKQAIRVEQPKQQEQTVQRVASYDFYMPPQAVLKKINTLFDEAVKLQSVYDNKNAELNKILNSRDETVQQKFKSKIRIIDRINPSTTPAHASEDECNNSITQLERSVELLNKGILQLDSAIQFLSKK